MQFTQAIVRRPAPSCGAGLTTAELGAPDYDKTLTQFRVLRRAAHARRRADRTAAAGGIPRFALRRGHRGGDARIRGDHAPGAPARRGETVHIEAALAAHRDLLPMQAGRLDGGDVMRVGKRFTSA